VQIGGSGIGVTGVWMFGGRGDGLGAGVGVGDGTKVEPPPGARGGVRGELERGEVVLPGDDGSPVDPRDAPPGAVPFPVSRAICFRSSRRASRVRRPNRRRHFESWLQRMSARAMAARSSAGVGCSM
jgi:hypothetical protein